MEPRAIAHQRLFRQRLAGPPLASPAEVVRWLGAVQAQDYGGAKWAVAQRCQNATDATLDHALATGELLRTHALRPTWHFVTPEDIRWLLALTAPHVHTTNATYYRKYELDDTLLRRCHAIFADGLQGGRQLTRPELSAHLAAAGIIPGDTVRQSLIFMHAELEAVICSGGLRGKQHTYALLDERVPPAPALNRDAALGELARRYFTSHGPATLQDFQWWSGLSATDARHGLSLAQAELEQMTIDGKPYWYAAPLASTEEAAETAYLLPNYDEFSVSYADRSALVNPAVPAPPTPRDNIVFANMVIMNDQIIGLWKKTIKPKTVSLTGTIHTRLIPRQAAALHAAADRMGEFLGLPTHLAITQSNPATVFMPAPHKPE